MIDFKSVLKDFTSISSIQEDEALKYKNIIKLSITFVLNNLKPGADIKSNLNLLSMLCASIAFYNYTLIKESLNPSSSVKLGDISVSSNSKSAIATAKDLKNELLSMASPLLLSPNFIFRQV